MEEIPSWRLESGYHAQCASQFLWTRYVSLSGSGSAFYGSCSPLDFRLALQLDLDGCADIVYSGRASLSPDRPAAFIHCSARPVSPAKYSSRAPKKRFCPGSPMGGEAVNFMGGSDHGFTVMCSGGASGRMEGGMVIHNAWRAREGSPNRQ